MVNDKRTANQKFRASLEAKVVVYCESIGELSEQLNTDSRNENSAGMEIVRHLLDIEKARLELADQLLREFNRAFPRS